MKVALQGQRLALRVLAAVALGMTLLGSALAQDSPTYLKGKGWEYWRRGSDQDIRLSAPAKPTSAMMGGSVDVDEAFRWLVGKAGGGDFVILNANGDTFYQTYVFDTIGGVDSVETLTVKTAEAANDPFVIDRVARAEVLFIGGGDQADYVKNWAGTELAKTIGALQRRNAPISGISAGLAVMGAVDFAALNGTVSSAEALADPYNKRVTLDSSFLVVAGLEDTTTDSHFANRNRMGRLLTFLARNLDCDPYASPTARGIGVDAGAAVLLDHRTARLVVQPGWEGARAYFLRPLIGPTVCADDLPLTFRSVQVDRLSAGTGAFDLGHWQGSFTLRYYVDAVEGVLTSSQPGGSVY